MLITTNTGTTTTAAQQTTAANSTSTAANVTVAAESGFEVLRGTTTDPLGTTPPPAPTTGSQPSDSTSLGGLLLVAAKSIVNLAKDTLDAGHAVPEGAPPLPKQQDPIDRNHDDVMQILRNL
jgi:hypothetical protein